MNIRPLQDRIVVKRVAEEENRPWRSPRDGSLSGQPLRWSTAQILGGHGPERVLPR